VIDALREAFLEIRESPWQPVTLLAFLGASAAFALLFLVAATSRDGWVMFLDGINLVFHEAGHPIFSIFGDTIHILGGTLGQLLVPALVAGTFWKQRHTVGFALCGLWFFENFLNIGRYMADARAQVLPLVGGGEHDWFNLFLKWGCLRSDTAIAAKFRAVGWIGMCACWCWLAWRWRKEREAAQ
jgi:hypothetical protein